MSTKRLLVLVGTALMLFCLHWFGAFIIGCRSQPQEVMVGTTQGQDLVPVSCIVSQVRYPTTQSDLEQVYNGRTFYYDGIHLGYDIQLTQGLTVAPIACGTVRFYGPAKGYGQLVVVVEHQLANPLTVMNGKGEQVSIMQFMSIYGHLRKTPVQGGGNALTWKVGDTVGPNDVIGYVNDDAHNGDGAEHLHLGIRLQTAVAAQASDPHAWFRGYDGSPSQRRWYADPALFMPALLSGTMPVLWHPAGTVLHHAQDNTFWMLDENGYRHVIDPTTVIEEQLAPRAVSAIDAELSCESIASAFVSPRAGHQVIKFTDASAVYEYSGPIPGAWRKVFISYEAFQSWGWRDVDIQLRSPDERPAFFQATQDQGFQTLRDGTLIKADSSSEVCVVAQGHRLPVASWDTFLALGYQAGQIVTVANNVIDAVAGSKGALITSDNLSVCSHPSACVDDCPPTSPGGGTGEEEGEGGPSDGTGGVGGSGGSPAASTSSSSGTGAGGMSGTTTSSTSTSVTTTSGSGGEAASKNSDPGPSQPDSGVMEPSGNGANVPLGKVHFHYEGPIVPGTNQLQAMWNPPGPVFYDWIPATFALCPDLIPNDGLLDCDLDMPSGTTGFLFTVLLGDGRWWGDWSCAPTGGCGKPIGLVTLTGPSGLIVYQYQPNQFGPDYQNGWLPIVP